MHGIHSGRRQVLRRIVSPFDKHRHVLADLDGCDATTLRGAVQARSAYFRVLLDILRVSFEPLLVAPHQSIDV